MAPSRSYTGRRDDPPRYMGEGFVVLQSNNVDIYAYMDVPGWVPETGDETGTERLANGDPCQSPPPVCGIEVKVSGSEVRVRSEVSRAGQFSLLNRSTETISFGQTEVGDAVQQVGLNVLVGVQEVENKWW